MKIPVIFGMSLPIWGGIVIFLLLVFQILTGLGKIKVPYKVHKFTAYIILLIGILHAVLGIGIWFGWLAIG